MSEDLISVLRWYLIVVFQCIASISSFSLPDSILVMSIEYCINGCESIDSHLTLVRTLVLHVFTQLVQCIQSAAGSEERKTWCYHSVMTNEEGKEGAHR